MHQLLRGAVSGGLALMVLVGAPAGLVLTDELRPAFGTPGRTFALVVAALSVPPILFGVAVATGRIGRSLKANVIGVLMSATTLALLAVPTVVVFWVLVILFGGGNFGDDEVSPYFPVMAIALALVWTGSSLLVGTLVGVSVGRSDRRRAVATPEPTWLAQPSP